MHGHIRHPPPARQLTDMQNHIPHKSEKQGACVYMHVCEGCKAVKDDGAKLRSMYK